MALNTRNPAPKPEIYDCFDSTDPRMAWPDRAGGSWTPDAALPLTLSELIVHWREANTPPVTTVKQALVIAGQDAHYHAFDRDWDMEMPGVQGADGLQYHYYIVNGMILHTRPETKRLWHASSANGHSLGICLAAGHGDPLRPPNVLALRALLDWFCFGRGDLPLITPTPRAVAVMAHDGTARTVHSFGVSWHDEARVREGLPPKGCCGLYRPIVAGWRQERAGSAIT